MTVSTVNVSVVPGSGWKEVATSPSAPWYLKPNFPGTYQFALTASTAPQTVPTGATGSVIFAGLPTAGQTVLIGGETYTFRASRSAPFEVTIGADATATGTNFATAVNTDSQLVTGVNTTGTVALTARVLGSGGNAITLSTAATNVSVSGATMTTGSNAVQGMSYGGNPYLIYEGIGPLPSFTGKAWVKVDKVDNQAQVTGNYPVTFTTVFTA